MSRLEAELLLIREVDGELRVHRVADDDGARPRGAWARARSDAPPRGRRG